MGMYDHFCGKCPMCGKDTYSQTKLEECIMKDFNLGDKIDMYDCKIQCKDPCECGATLVAEIKHGLFLGFVNEKPTEIEVAWGGTEEVQDDS